MLNTCVKNYTVDSNCVDYKKKYELCSLMRHFHEAVDEHALAMGVDATTVWDNYGAIWIITRIRVDIDEMPDWHEEIRVETYPLTPGLVRMEREAVFTRKAAPFARLSSEWCLLDKVSGRPRRPLQTGYPAALVHREGRVTEEYSKFSPVYEENDFVYSHGVRVSDLDMNVHMNNVAYIRLACDAFDVRELSALRIASFEIQFKAQSYEGEEIKLYRRTAGGDGVFVSGVKPNGVRVFDALLTLKQSLAPRPNLNDSLR